MSRSATWRCLSALLTIALLTACGSAATTITSTTTASTAPAASVAAESPAASTSASPSAEASPAAETTATTAAGAGSGTELTVYSGRSEELVGPLIEQYQATAGVTINVKYGDTAELAATILEEGANSPADVFFAQDAGALGALASEDRLARLPNTILRQVDERFRSPDGAWVGVSGRARVVVFNTATYTATELPDTIFGFTDPKFRGRIGWAPTNGSFQAFVTALRVLEGEDRAREWLQGMQANEPKVYENNTAVVQAAAAGEIDVGFVNHYYLFRQLAEKGQSFGARNYYLKNGDPGALINVAGTGILNSAKNTATAEAFISFLLSAEAQRYFADETYEYPLVEGIAPNQALPALSEIQTPNLDLSRLDDLQGTLQLMQDVGVL